MLAIAGPDLANDRGAKSLPTARQDPSMTISKRVGFGFGLRLTALGCFALSTAVQAQENLECASGEAQQILNKTLDSRFAPPAARQLEAMARGDAGIPFSVQLGTIETLDSKPVFRQCFAQAFVITNGHRQEVHVRYSLFLDDTNRLILRTDEVTR